MAMYYIPAGYKFNPAKIKTDCILYRNFENEEPNINMCKGLSYMVCADANAKHGCPFYKPSEAYNPDGSSKSADGSTNDYIAMVQSVYACSPGKRFTPD